MNNQSLPNTTDALLASSNALEPSTPLQSPDKQHLPNDQKTIFMKTLHDIESGHISKPEEFDPALNELWRKIAHRLLLAMQKGGIEGYRKAYAAIISGSIHFTDPAPQPPRRESKASAPVGTLLSEVQAKPVRWLWQDRLPLGKLTTLNGDPSLGKSHLALDIAARVSSGREMPDGTPGIPGGAGVVLIAPDDGLADTIRPRLQRAGANLSRIVSIGNLPVTDSQGDVSYERPFQLPDDIEILLEAIKRVQAKLVIIDPLMTILNPKGTSRRTTKNAELKKSLALVQMVIEFTGAACLIIGPLTRASGSSPLSHTSESIATIAPIRSELIILRDPTDESQRVLAHIKSNLSAQAPSLSFSITSDKNSTDPRPYILWQGQCYQTLQELLNPPIPVVIQPLGTARQEILSVLQEYYPEPLTIKALAEELPEIGNANLRKTLQRMATDGQIQQSARGEYSAFPPSPPSPNQKDPSQVSQVSQQSQPIRDNQDLSQVSQQSQESQSITNEQGLSQEPHWSQESQQSQPITS